MEHQLHNSIGGENFNSYLYRNFNWKNHFHKRYELTFVTNGSLLVEIDGKKYKVNEGYAVLVMPFCIHSFFSNLDTEFLTVVFDESYIKAFASATASKVPLSPVFKPDELTAKVVYKSLGREGEPARDNQDSSYMVKVSGLSVLEIKAGLYAFCANAFSAIEWVNHTRDDKLTFNIISFISENFATDISLSSMAQSLGYDYGYLSRMFNDLFSTNFRTLLNQFRCDYAYSLITSSSDTLSEIALKSGFQSIRSFNRVFKEIVGVSPNEIRKSR